LAHVLDWAAQRGAKRERLLERVAVARELLEDAEARIPLEAYYAGLEAAVDELGDPFLGLHYIASVDPSALGALGFLALASPTAGAALERIFRHHAWLSEGEVFAMDVVGGEARFRYVPHGPPLLDELRRERAEVYLAMGLAISEVSYLVGFAEPSTFFRAFKRWTGETPADFRGRSQGGRG
jgi:AraC-like DNA-binding protein